MEHQIMALFDGTVEALPHAKGAQVAARDVLAILVEAAP
jgi:biotin carboxyl carrier protein